MIHLRRILTGLAVVTCLVPAPGRDRRARPGGRSAVQDGHRGVRQRGHTLEGPGHVPGLSSEAIQATTHARKVVVDRAGVVGDIGAHV
jgi:hypothetical protein